MLIFYPEPVTKVRQNIASTADEYLIITGIVMTTKLYFQIDVVPAIHRYFNIRDSSSQPSTSIACAAAIICQFAKDTHSSSNLKQKL